MHVDVSRPCNWAQIVPAVTQSKLTNVTEVERIDIDTDRELDKNVDIL